MRGTEITRVFVLSLLGAALAMSACKKGKDTVNAG